MFSTFAENTMDRIAVSPDDLEPVDVLLNCILNIRSWMAENFLQLNQDKTEVLIFGPENKREMILPKLQNFKSSQCVRTWVFFSTPSWILFHILEM